MATAVQRRKPSLRNKVIEYIRDDTSIPSFPIAVKKVNNLLRCNDVDLGKVAVVASTDPGLTAKFLKLANSVAFGGGERVTSLTAAMMRIGLRNVKNLTMSMGVLDASKRFRLQVNWENYWKHNMLSARIAESLASAYTLDPHEAYIAGLLHRIGALFIQHYFPNEFDSILLDVNQSGKSFAEAERKVFDITHAHIGALVCERWQIEANIANAIRHYDQAHNVPQTFQEHHRLLVICVALASRIAEMYTQDVLNRPLECQTIEKLPEWEMLNEFSPTRDLELDLEQLSKEVDDTLLSLSRN